MIKVLFLILNYKTYKDTIKLTDELVAEGLSDKFVLIVDNASPNESFNALSSRYFDSDKVEVIQSPENGGFAKGNNFGLRYAVKYSPKYVCIINNDVHFKLDMVDRLCMWYERLPNVAMIAPVQLLPNGEPAKFESLAIPSIGTDVVSYIPHLFKFIYPGLLYQAKENTSILGVYKAGLIPGAFSFIDYNLMSRLGFYDEDTFLFCEERFFAKKAKLAGYDNYIILDESYLHQHSMTINKEATQKMQKKMILKERCNYYRKYSKHPVISIALLKMASSFGNFYSKVASTISK